MAFANVWNYCVPLAVITMGCLLRTGECGECDVNEKCVEVCEYYCYCI